MSEAFEKGMACFFMHSNPRKIRLPSVFMPRHCLALPEKMIPLEWA
jgi:hypothetical protein